MYYRQKLRRATVFAAILVSLFSVISAALPQPVAAAANGSFIDTATLTQVKNHQKYYWLRNCFFTYDIDTVTQDEMKAWDFFEGAGKAYEIIGAVYGADAGATWGCAEGDNVRTAFAALGLTNPIEAFCKIDGAEYGGLSSAQRCIAGAGGASWDNKASRDAQGKSFEKLAAASAPEVVRPINDVENYVRYYVSLQNQCGVIIQSGEYQEGSADDDDTYRVPVVNYDKKQIQYRLGIGEKSSGSQVAIVATKTGTPYTNGDGLNITGQTPRGEVITCNETVDRLRGYAQAYQDFINANEGKLTEATDTGGTTTPDETCESKGGPLSWFMCPVLALLDGGIFALTNAVESLLSVEYNKYSDPDGPVVQTWQVMRNIALLILVPMMLLMVIGTALEFGPFDAYTVKKALPRMVLAVMFITLSLPITSFFINLSNVVGYGIQGLILTASNSPESLMQLYEAREGALFSYLVIAGIGVAGATGAITFGIILSLALVVFVTLLIGYVILVIRELLILVLIIVAPLAILVWIFPANDKLWKIWKTTFIALLMMFPIIILLITSGKVFAGLIAETQSPFTSFFLKIIALIAPFFFIPATFKYGLGVFGNLAGMINDRSRGLFDRQRKFREGSKANARARARAGQRFAGGNSSNWRGRLNRGIGGGLNAPSAILSTGNLTKPGNWAAATMTQMGNNNLAEVERNMKENPHYQSWMYNDDLNRAAAETNNEQELRDRLSAQGMTGQALEDSVNRVQAVRRSMDPNAFRIMTTRQAIAGGTAYKDGNGNDAGLVAMAMAKAAGSDDAALQYLVANGRSEGMKAGRVDYAGATFSGTLDAADTLRQKMMRGEAVTINDIEMANNAIHKNVLEGQGGAALVHSSMKPAAVAEMAPEMLADVRSNLGNDQGFAESLATMAAVYDGMAGSSPSRAKIMSDKVMGQKLNISTLSPEMQAAFDQHVDQDGEISVQKAIEVVRASNNPYFLQRRREYNSLINYQAAQGGPVPPGTPPGGLPTGP